jgi:DNA helicase-2/ATP-dependent DNA helicase PcrA
MSDGKTTIYVASAGTGKTTTLINKLEECLEHTDPSKVCFTTFTKSGAQEAIDRVVAKFDCNEKDLEGFSTLHAYCYRRIPRKQMLNREDYKIMGELIGLTITGSLATATSWQKDTSFFSNLKGDKLLYYNGLMRNMLCSEEEVLAQQIDSSISTKEFVDFNEFYYKYKYEKNKYDFTDQLEVFNNSEHTPKNDYLFVDESQDLSPLQWQVINKLSTKTKHTYIAGDDKQSIYKFSGGDPKSLIEKEGNRIVLDETYRLPSKVLEYAETITSRIENKQEYTVKSHKDGGGVHRIRSLNELDLNDESWLFLARNRALLRIYEDFLIKRRILFISSGENSLFNEDQINYILLWEKLRLGYKFKAQQLKVLYNNYLPSGAVIARGAKSLLDSMPDHELYDKVDLVNNFGLKSIAKWNKVFKLNDVTKEVLLKAEAEDRLDKCTNIEVTTIHASKGREADNVVVLPDLTTLTAAAYKKDPDNEHRVFYVAATRAKQNLFLLYPYTSKFYNL